MSADNPGNAISKSSPVAKQAFSRLVIDASGEEAANAYSLNKALAEELLKIRPRLRSLQMEKCLLNVLMQLPEDAVVKDVDVLFNPEYTIDVLMVLISAYKRRPFKLIWPGSCKNGQLIYSEANYPDYKAYDVREYDIICLY